MKVLSTINYAPIDSTAIKPRPASKEASTATKPKASKSKKKSTTSKKRKAKVSIKKAKQTKPAKAKPAKKAELSQQEIQARLDEIEKELAKVKERKSSLNSEKYKLLNKVK